MQSFRDIKRKARQDLHSHMKVLAYYIPSTNSDPITLHVRIQTKWGATTMDTPTNSGSLVERQSAFPKILFMLDELAEKSVKLRRNAIISVAEGEAYRLEASEPFDFISQSWIVTQLDAGDAEGLAYPTSEDEDG